jgi:hypothetical protein
MEDCNICYSKIKEEEKKLLSCKHSLCKSCYLRLATQKCPYCREPFLYTQDEIRTRQELNIKYNNNTPPSQLFDESILLNNFNQLTLNNRQNNNVNYIDQVPFSRLTRNKNRKRRRNLSEDEVRERREIIRKKCKRKWKLKEGRLNKIKWYDIIQ